MIGRSLPQKKIGASSDTAEEQGRNDRPLLPRARAPNVGVKRADLVARARAWAPCGCARGTQAAG